MKLLKSVKLKTLLLTVIFISVIFIFPSELFAEIYKFWVDTSHWETRTGRRWIDTSYTVTQGYWQYYSTRIWVDTSYTVSQGYWHYYSTTDWIDTSHWVYEDVWVEEGHWIEADINLEGKVLHTLHWDKNRISYNLSKTGNDSSPRGYEIFFKMVIDSY